MNPLRIGICGLGRAGWNMVYQAVKDHPGMTVVAGADIMAERTAELQDACGAKPYPELEAMVQDPDVELVVIANGSRDHASSAIAALEAGKHVLVEKPLALTLDETDKIFAKADQSQGTLLVRHNRRFDPPLLMSKQIIASGKIGEVFRVQLRQGGYQRRKDWQTLRAHGGGQLLNWGPHMIDWAMQLLGGPARDVWSDLRRVAAAGDAEDQVKVLIRGAGGAIADIETGGATAIGQPGWHVLGTHGAFVIDGQEVHLRYYDPSGVDAAQASSATPKREYGSNETLPWLEQTLPLEPEDKQEFWNAVVATIRDGQPFPITHAEARENMRVIDLARRGSEFEMQSAPANTG